MTAHEPSTTLPLDEQGRLKFLFSILYVVEKIPERGNPVTDYISTKSLLLLRRDSVIASETTHIELPQTEYYSDYRLVDGMMVPFKILANNIANGDIVTRVKDVKFDVEIPDSVLAGEVNDWKERGAG